MSENKELIVGLHARPAELEGLTKAQRLQENERANLTAKQIFKQNIGPILSQFDEVTLEEGDSGLFPFVILKGDGTQIEACAEHLKENEQVRYLEANWQAIPHGGFGF